MNELAQSQKIEFATAYEPINQYKPTAMTEIVDHDSYELLEKERKVYERLVELERNTISGQFIDEIKSNYELRSKNAKFRLNVSAV